jgi:hypothetical protein
MSKYMSQKEKYIQTTAKPWISWPLALTNLTNDMVSQTQKHSTFALVDGVLTLPSVRLGWGKWPTVPRVGGGGLCLFVLHTYMPIDVFCAIRCFVNLDVLQLTVDIW